MEQQNKRWFFYNEKGEIYLIYIIEPPKEMLDTNTYVEGIEAKAREGFTIKYSVNLVTKELKIDYEMRELTLNEKLKQMQDAIDVLMMGGMR